MSELTMPFKFTSPSGTKSLNDDLPDCFKLKVPSGTDEGIYPSDHTTIDQTSKPKRGRPKKNPENNVIPISGVIPPMNTGNENISEYHKAYQETNGILKTAIVQTDALINTISDDLSKIRESKAMTNKYKYITELGETMSSLISTKISAARELNNAITHANDMEFKREKELKALETTKDDDKTVMDLYNAYMSVPIGTYNGGPTVPSIQDITLANGTNLQRIDILPQQVVAPDYGYNQYVNNLTPEQNRMRYEDDPNIQTVVIYDQSNGKKSFDVIDMRTGQSIPNVAKPDDFLLDDTRPDLVNKVARNSNINATYPLIIVGEKSTLLDY